MVRYSRPLKYCELETQYRYDGSGAHGGGHSKALTSASISSSAIITMQLVVPCTAPWPNGSIEILG